MPNTRCTSCDRRFDRPAAFCCEHVASHVSSSVASDIVNAIEQDILGRHGLGDEFEACDLEIQDEIRDTWVEIAERHVAARMDDIASDGYSIGEPDGD